MPHRGSEFSDREHQESGPPPLIRLLAQIGTGQREVADEVAGSARHEGDGGRYDHVYALPLVGDREVKGKSGSFHRAGAVEGRTDALPTSVFDNANVARSRGGKCIGSTFDSTGAVET